MKKIIIGLTGASGSIYFVRLVEELIKHDIALHLVASKHGEQVLKYEKGVVLADKLTSWQTQKAVVVLENNDNLFSTIASGSSKFDAMAILPCSMSTLGTIAHGITETLLTRAADVMLKERRQLVLVPRETPLSAIHLENMATLAKCGAVILPAMPGFYHHPQSFDDLVNFVVGKTLDSLGFNNNLYKQWNGV